MVDYYYNERKERASGYCWGRGYRHGMGFVLSEIGIAA